MSGTFLRTMLLYIEKEYLLNNRIKRIVNYLRCMLAASSNLIIRSVSSIRIMMGPLNGERLTISIFLPGWIPRADALCANEGSNVVWEIIPCFVSLFKIIALQSRIILIYYNEYEVVCQWCCLHRCGDDILLKKIHLF